MAERKRYLASGAPRRWTAGHPDGGRVDVNGVEWFACDPYPTWYRWEDGKLFTCGVGRATSIQWADENTPLPRPVPTGLGSLITELRDSIERFDAVPHGRYWPVQTAAVIDCARDVVQEWNRRRG